MNIKLLLQHGTSIYDATPILEGRVEWFASVMGKAGRLKFRVVRDGIVNFVEGDRVSFYVDSVLRFSGFVMTKERTSEQIISVTAYDQMFYLVRNKGTYVFLNKSAKEIIHTSLCSACRPSGRITAWRLATSMTADGGFRRELRRGKH